MSARELLQLFPHFGYVAVSDAAHMVDGDRNDVCGDAALTFLSRAVTTGRVTSHVVYERRRAAIAQDDDG
jgi:hypothetical protein